MNLPVECVPNFSEGRDLARIALLEQTIASVAGVRILDKTADPDHNRSVITFAGAGHSVLEAALRAAERAAELIDLNRHSGIHPRLGALDVLPFVPLGDTRMEDCIDLAHLAGERIWRELGIPVYFYEGAAKRPERKRLEEVRRGGFEALRELVLTDESKRPDLGGPGLHATAGAVIVGARPILIAYNVNLATRDVEVAKRIARAVRASNGGLPCVKALGLPLASRELVQVSINLTDFRVTPLHLVFAEVARLAESAGVAIVESELIGLIPREAVEMAFSQFLKLTDFNSRRVIENRLESQ